MSKHQVRASMHTWSNEELNSLRALMARKPHLTAGDYAHMHCEKWPSRGLTAARQRAWLLIRNRRKSAPILDGVPAKEGPVTRYRVKRRVIVEEHTTVEASSATEALDQTRDDNLAWERDYTTVEGLEVRAENVAPSRLVIDVQGSGDRKPATPNN